MEGSSSAQSFPALVTIICHFTLLVITFRSLRKRPLDFDFSINPYLFQINLIQWNDQFLRNHASYWPLYLYLSLFPATYLYVFKLFIIFSWKDYFFCILISIHLTAAGRSLHKPTFDSNFAIFSYWSLQITKMPFLLNRQIKFIIYFLQNINFL